jgi:benzoyl-CoA reductase/2-hydroxyglutaryl-CoA dehydratase subunit BcrC/BadD/HgdB
MLAESVRQGQRIDAAICDIYNLRGENRIDVSNADFYRILRAGEYVHPDEYLPFLKQVIQKSGSAGQRKTPVVLSGVLPGPPAFQDLLDNLGLRVAADDLLSCSRRLQVHPGPAEDPYEALADRYFRMPVCPTRNSTLARRFQRLLALVRSTRAAGVIFYVLPFCDPELFDLPPLVAELKNAGIRSLVVEAGMNRQLSGQVAVRVEAFAEMIGSEREK